MALRAEAMEEGAGDCRSRERAGVGRTDGFPAIDETEQEAAALLAQRGMSDETASSDQMFLTQVPRAVRSRAESGSDECGDDDRANDDRRDSVAAVNGLWEEAERMFL